MQPSRTLQKSHLGCRHIFDNRVFSIRTTPPNRNYLAVKFTHRPLLLLSLALSLFFPFSLQAETEYPEHSLLESSETLSYPEVFRAAAERALELPLTAAYEDRARAQQNFANDWIANRPRMKASYWDDQYGDNQGLRELEAGLEVDLWRWGQRRDNSLLGEYYQRTSISWHDYLALKVAGEVRQALHELASTDIQFDQAKQALADTGELLKVSETLFATGAIPKASVMQSRGLVLQAQQRLLDVEASRVDAQRNYNVITGLTQRPATSFTEQLSPQTEITAAHPLLGFLQDQLDSQHTQAKVIRHDNAGSPSLFMGMRRERGSGSEANIDSLGIAISVPFGGGDYISAKTSAANLAATETEVQFQQAYRQLRQQLHEIEHQLESTRHGLALSEQRRDLHRQHWQMAKKAFSLGESDILPAMQALQQYRESRLHYQLTELSYQRLISEFNQIIGVLP